MGVPTVISLFSDCPWHKPSSYWRSIIDESSMFTKMSHQQTHPALISHDYGFPQFWIWYSYGNPWLWKPNYDWLVISTPLKHISQLGLLFPIYVKKCSKPPNRWYKHYFQVIFHDNSIVFHLFPMEINHLASRAPRLLCHWGLVASVVAWARLCWKRNANVKKYSTLW